MWANIYWIYFDNKELHHYIRNSTNTDNWPTVKKFGAILADFKQKIEVQKEISKEIEETNKKVKEIINNIQDWFKQEYDFLAKKENANQRPYQKEDLYPFLKETNYEKFSEFLRNLLANEEEDEPELMTEEGEWEELRSLLAEWYQLIQGKETQSNPYQVYVHERKQGSVTFSWKVPERKFYDLANYLFNYYGEWMMVADWQQTDYSMVKITAASSIFYNRYWYFLKSGGNGILKHSPLARIEACHCSSSPNISAFYDITVEDYKLDLKLWRLKGGLNALGAERTVIVDEKPPIFSVSQLEQVSPSDNDFETQMGALWDAAVGGVFFLLGNRFSGFTSSPNYFEFTNFKQKARAWLNAGNKNLVSDPNFFHILQNNIKATIYWRNKHIWQGNYWLLHDQIRIYEIITSAGNSIVIESQGIIIAKVTENITMKIGGNNIINKFFEVIVDTSLNDDKGQNNRQTERKILKAEKEFAKPTLYSVDHTKSEYTFMQFLSRFGGSDSGDYPLKIRLEINEDTLNEYKNSRELKGKCSHQFFNTPAMANFLLTPGYLQANFISCNYPYGDWFTGKIASGVYLYDKEPLEFYQRKLSNPLSIPSLGDLRRQPFETLTVLNRINVGSGFDNVSHLGGGLYVYKDSYAYAYNERNERIIDLFPWLMNEIQKRRNCWTDRGNIWVYKHPENWEEEIKIPSQYLSNNRTHEGQGTVRIDYRFHFFSSNDSRDLTNSELYATKFIVKRESFGNRGQISIQIIGNLTIRNTVGDPGGVPPTTQVRGSNIDLEIPDPDPFDPDNAPDPNTPEPSPDVPAGEPEPNVPEPDPVPDIDPSPDVPEPDPNEPDAPDADPTPDLGDYDNNDND